MEHAGATPPQNRPLIFGEVLFDNFTDGKAMLGGAAFNVAWHLRGLGLHPLLISRVGNDAQGERVLQAMRAWGMDVRGVQRDDERPTGSVLVEVEHGEPSFTILPLQAYDFIDHEPAFRACGNETFSLLYHGTLIARNSASFETLLALRELTALPAFVDVNLRSPWWSGEIVESTLQGARWGKMNSAELGEIVNDPVLTPEKIEDAARELSLRYGLNLLVITSDAEGAWFITQTSSHFEPAPVVEQIVDTVGAGDAFSAVILLGLSQQWPLPLIQQRALEFAAAVCRIPGAISEDKTFYAGQLARWKA